MVLQIVLPEPRNDANHRRNTGGGGGADLVTKLTTNLFHFGATNHFTHQQHSAAANQEPTQHWLQRAESVNSLTESRIGEDSLFSYGLAGMPVGGGANTTDLLSHLRTGIIRDDLKNLNGAQFHYPESHTPNTHSAGRPDVAPTTEEDKKSMFKGYLTVILSCIYAIFILMLGVVVYIADLITRKATMAEVFSVYLVILGLLWLIFLYCDIRRHQSTMRKERSKAASHLWTPETSQDHTTQNPNYHKDETFLNHSHHLHHHHHNNNHHAHIHHNKRSTTPATNEEVDIGSEDCISHVSVPVSPRSDSSKHHKDGGYTFCRSRHSGSFYLKIGAAGFCFGHLIHSGLLLCRQIIFFTTEDQKVFDRCANVTNLILEVLFPIYSFLLLFVIFKYSNVIINRHQELSRFALMHCISSSLCFWFWSILRETADSLYHKMLQHNEHHGHGNHHHHHHSQNHFPLPSSSAESLESLIALPLSYIEEVGVLFIMWQNIGKGEESRRRRRFRLSSYHSQDNEFPPSSFTNHLVIHADCHSANKGLFAGLLVLVGTVVSVIIFYIALDESRSGLAAQWVNLTSQGTLLILMIITVLVAYRQITKLDVNMHPVSLLDDLLLFFCLPSFFLYTIFTVVPAMAHQDYYAIVVCTLQVIQVILQTPCIIDGLRRCSNSEKLRQEKPGRELVTFLIVCNIAMWVIETFEIKSAYAQHEQISFYGSILWTLLSHMTLPLTLFYRFHSSVCLVDIWKSAYESGE